MVGCIWMQVPPFCLYHSVRIILSNTILYGHHPNTYNKQNRTKVGWLDAFGCKFHHFVCTILSVSFCPIPFCTVTIQTHITNKTGQRLDGWMHLDASSTILSVPFCPYHFVQYHFVRSPSKHI